MSWGPLFSGRLTPIPPRPRGSGRPVLYGWPPSHPGFLTWLEVNGPQHFRHMLHAQGELIHSFIAPAPGRPASSTFDIVPTLQQPSGSARDSQHHYPRFPPLSVESRPPFLSLPASPTHLLINSLACCREERRVRVSTVPTSSNIPFLMPTTVLRVRGMAVPIC